MDRRHALGIQGERIAAEFLRANGYRLLDARARTIAGEIDLVAIAGGEVVFVEVKTRRSEAFGLPEEAITATKRSRLRRSALAWLAARGRGGAVYRIDVIAVLVQKGRAPVVRHHRHAVGCA